jgi:DNA-binding Xre family transcriptional regulator
MAGMVKIKREVIDGWMKGKTTPPKTYDELAKEIRISNSLLSLMLDGKRQAKTSVIGKICELTGYSVGDIAYYDKNGRIEKPAPAKVQL